MQGPTRSHTRRHTLPARENLPTKDSMHLLPGKDRFDRPTCRNRVSSNRRRGRRRWCVQLDSVLSTGGAIIFNFLGRRSRPYVSSLVGLLTELGRMADWVNHRLVLHYFPSAGDVMDL